MVTRRKYAKARSRKRRSYGMSRILTAAEKRARYGPTARQYAKSQLPPFVAPMNPMQLHNRSVDRYYGNGDYKSFVRYLNSWKNSMPRSDLAKAGLIAGGGALGGALGTMELPFVGTVEGAAAGGAAGAGLSKWLGFGDYKNAITNRIHR